VKFDSHLFNFTFEKVLALAFNVAQLKPPIKLVKGIEEFYFALELMAHSSKVNITEKIPKVIVLNSLPIFESYLFPARSS